MAEPHVMDALRGKRSELSGIVSRLEQQIVHHRASLVHLDAAMRLFDPDLVPEESGPSRQRMNAAVRWSRRPSWDRSAVRRPRSSASRSLAWSRGGSARRLARVASSRRSDRWAASHRQADDAVRLLAVADPAQVLWTCRLLRVVDEIGAGDVVVMPKLAAAQAGEVGFCPVGAGAVDAVAVLVVDPLHGEPGVQRVPGRAFVGVHHGAFGDALTDGRHGGFLAAKHLRQRAAIALAHHHHNSTFARPVLSLPPVDPVGCPVLRPDMAAEVGAVDLSHPSFAADLQPLRAGRPVGFADITPWDRFAIASRSLCASTKAVLYCTSKSRARASMLCRVGPGSLTPSRSQIRT